VYTFKVEFYLDVYVICGYTTPMAAKKTAKEVSIQIRATKAQKAKLAKAAEKRGLGLSTWMLMLSLAEAEKTDGGSEK
jgi:hypothetical protein